MNLKVRLFDAALSDKFNYVNDLLLKGEIAAGKHIDDIEKWYSRYHESESSYAFANMTVAIRELLLSLGVTNKSTIACHPFCCLSSTAAIAEIGAKILWLDFDVAGPWISVSGLNSLDCKIDILFNYNVGGYSGCLDKIDKFCSDHNIHHINDCNASSLSMYQKKPVGSYGDFSVHSNYPNRHLRSIDGGIIVCNKKDHSQLKIRQRLGVTKQDYRDDYGEIDSKCDISIATGANNMSNISAAFLKTSLSSVDDIRNRYMELESYYSDVFNGFSLNKVSDFNPVPWLYPILVESPLKAKLSLKKVGVDSTRLHVSNVGYSIFKNAEGVTHNVNKFFERALWLPLSEEIDNFKEVLL